MQVVQCFCIKGTLPVISAPKRQNCTSETRHVFPIFMYLTPPHQILVSPRYVSFLDAVTLKYVKLQFYVVTWTPLSLRYALTPTAIGSLRNFSECTVGKYHIMKIATIKLITTRWNRLYIQFYTVREISPSIKVLYAIFNDFVWV